MCSVTAVQLVAVVSTAVQSGTFSPADKYELMATCRHESSTVPDVAAFYAGHVCTGTSPSRGRALPARTAARLSSDGERRERV